MCARIDRKWRIPDELWQEMEPLLPKYQRSPKGGKPRLPLRQVADGIFYVLRTGCQWKAAPREFGSSSSLHAYFQEWTQLGVFHRLWRRCLGKYDKWKGIAWRWQSLDGAMTKAPLGGEKNREKPHRSGQVGREAVGADRCSRRTSGRGCGWRECP
jgi:putative transposase